MGQGTVEPLRWHFLYMILKYIAAMMTYYNRTKAFPPFTTKFNVDKLQVKYEIMLQSRPGVTEQKSNLKR